MIVINSQILNILLILIRFLNTYFNHLHNTSIIFLIFISEKN